MTSGPPTSEPEHQGADRGDEDPAADVQDQAGLCEIGLCQRRASGYVAVQWTVADFIRYECCAGCRSEAISILARRTVDRQLPYDVFYGSY